MNENELNFENYLPNEQRKNNALYSFYAAFLLCAISIIIGIYYYFELKKYADLEIEDISTLETVYYVSTILFSLSIISTIIFFTLWFRRAYANLRRVGIDIENNDSMAFWGFVIPFMNLVKPLKIAKEIDLKYDFILQKINEEHKQNLNNYSIITAWFSVYWIDIIVSRLANKTQFISMGQMVEYHGYMLGSYTITLLSIGLTILMIRTISKSETDLEQYLKLEELSAPNQ